MRLGPVGLLVAVIVLVSACAATPTPSPAATPGGTAAATTAAPPVSSSTPSVPGATLAPGAVIDGEYFEESYMKGVVRAFLDGLARAYEAGDGADLFTPQGEASARRWDWRYRDALQAELRFRERHELRVAFEGSNSDPTGSPPRFEVDAIFDVPAGAVVADSASGATIGRSSGVERRGFHLAFVFGGRWLVDDVGPVSPDYLRWLELPTSVPAARPCEGFRREAGSLFDDDATRAWCDADGRGRAIGSQELALITRYPCDEGHAAVLTIGRPLGMPIDPLLRWEYVRDPQGEFLAQGWIAEPWRGEAAAPDDLLYTGWTNGNVELWISPSELDAAVYLRLGGALERWPRAVDPWGVIDCN